MRDRMNAWLGLAGPAAAALFFTALVGFAALRTDGYSHATKAVSELGAVGAQNAQAFNLVGFILPGLLVAALAMGLARGLGATAGPLLLAVAGLGYALAGVFPFDMEARESTTSLLHLGAAQLCGLAFSFAVFPLGSAMRRHPAFTALGRVTPWFALALVANVGWQVLWRVTGLVLPGWGQRIAFVGFFLWVTLAGMLLARVSQGGEVREVVPPA